MKESQEPEGQTGLRMDLLGKEPPTSEENGKEMSTEGAEIQDRITHTDIHRGQIQRGGDWKGETNEEGGGRGQSSGYQSSLFGFFFLLFSLSLIKPEAIVMQHKSELSHAVVWQIKQNVKAAAAI